LPFLPKQDSPAIYKKKIEYEKLESKTKRRGRVKKAKLCLAEGGKAERRKGGKVERRKRQKSGKGRKVERSKGERWKGGKTDKAKYEKVKS
jgi:hypothetical protein